MTVRMQFQNSGESSLACGAFSEFCQALSIGAVRRIEADGLTMLITLDVSEQFPREPILAMFAGLEPYYLRRVALEGVN